MDKVRLFIISGPASVGKTTVARILSAHLSEKTAIVDGDDVEKFGVAKEYSHYLFIKNARSLITNFLEEQIDVIFSHALSGEEIKEIIKDLKTEEIKVVYLKADLKTLELRNRTRSIEDQARASLKEELDFFSKLKIDSNFILDTSKLSLSQTAKAIISEKRFIIK